MLKLITKILLILFISVILLCIIFINTNYRKLKYNNFIKYINRGILINNLINNCINNYVLFTIWIGDNDLTTNRYKGLMSIKNSNKINMINVNPHNLHLFIKEKYPIHKAFKYLSVIHKSDYLRCYLMHHWGGGYSDIKPHKNIDKWYPLFDKIKYDDNIWAIGNTDSHSIEFPDDGDDKLRKEYANNKDKMIGVAYMIYRPYTKLTSDWYNKLHEKLDYHYPILKDNPAVYTREAFDRIPSRWCKDERDIRILHKKCPKEKTKYPIKWTEILGQINCPIQLKYLKHISNQIPDLKVYGGYG
tara:strand:+ start:2289 stop:3194 length:906 start_codon:yes stop_codon:yes gene_type:complete